MGGGGEKGSKGGRGNGDGNGNKGGGNVGLGRVEKTTIRLSLKQCRVDLYKLNRKGLVLR
jgi:hypothetical protein